MKLLKALIAVLSAALARGAEIDNKPDHRLRRAHNGGKAIALKCANGI